MTLADEEIEKYGSSKGNAETFWLSLIPDRQWLSVNIFWILWVLTAITNDIKIRSWRPGYHHQRLSAVEKRHIYLHKHFCPVVDMQTHYPPTRKWWHALFLRLGNQWETTTVIGKPTTVLHVTPRQSQIYWSLFSISNISEDLAITI